MSPDTSDASRLLTDTHCHLYWPGLAEHADEVVERALEAGVGTIVVPGINEETSLAAQALAQRFKGVYFAAGVHPSEVENSEGFRPGEFFAPFAGDPKLVAVGEIGLDAHYDPSAVERQRPILRAQLEYAVEHGLPVILHHRDAGRPLVTELERFSQLRGVFHCYDGSKRLLNYARNHDFYISLAGNVTYETAHNLHSQLERIPESKLVVETDSPWMPPAPVRGKRVSESADIVYTLDFVAGRLAKSVNMLRINVTRNSCGLFQIPGDSNGVQPKGH